MKTIESVDRLESANRERNEEIDSNVEEEESGESDFLAWWRAGKRWSMSWCFFTNASSRVSVAKLRLSSSMMAFV